ncbi:hypothetical protein MMC25_006104 [Agyrium rufum]|nr:hypothetical protein [Agyrium rufum]
MRRLASDHASLHKLPLPPHYLFAPSTAGSISHMSDDLTQLSILLTGPEGTPYAAGVWKLHLKIPIDYPKSPPKASFRTKIWHPNVDETTGSVCVDTLKRDWESKLTLRDVLVTISCLLIQPNPDSALNAAAGKLLQEDYEAFARQAKLMTSIHAGIPAAIKEAVVQVRRRGEEVEKKQNSREAIDLVPGTKRKLITHAARPQPRMITTNRPSHPNLDSDSEDEETPESASKENDPFLSPSSFNAPSAPLPQRRRPLLGKRPLSDLPTPTESDLEGEEASKAPNASEQNIAANVTGEITPSTSSFGSSSSIPSQASSASSVGTTASVSRKITLVERGRSFNESTTSSFSESFCEQPSARTSSFAGVGLAIKMQGHESLENGEDICGPPRRKRVCSGGDEKENAGEGLGKSDATMVHSDDDLGKIGPAVIAIPVSHPAPSTTAIRKPAVLGAQGVTGGLKKVPGTGSGFGGGKGKPRTGLRRL